MIIFSTPFLEQFSSPDLENFKLSHMRLIVVSNIYVTGKFFTCYMTDWVFDVYVLYSNYNLSMHVDKALSGNYTPSELHELGVSKLYKCFK